MPIVETNLPLADILIETGQGIVRMNNAMAPNGIGATGATVSIDFMASLQRGFDYTRQDHSGGAAFTFWLIGGAGAFSYSRSDLHVYNQYIQNIHIKIEITFASLATVA